MIERLLTVIVNSCEGLTIFLMFITNLYQTLQKQYEILKYDKQNRDIYALSISSSIYLYDSASNQLLSKYTGW